MHLFDTPVIDKKLTESMPQRTSAAHYAMITTSSGWMNKWPKPTAQCRGGEQDLQMGQMDTRADCVGSRAEGGSRVNVAGETFSLAISGCSKGQQLVSGQLGTMG
ncbi:hypothetical protein GJAV_G00266830 [Gymnothorax javanicus]|nr:hypothetical protein GJAV_G00266830 [Gymnothorax javanicus]